MSLKDAMELDLQVPVRLRAGAPGSLNVFLDGKQIFSKKQAKRSPEAGELVRLIRAQVSATRDSS